jgi:hypothetical protein
MAKPGLLMMLIRETLFARPVVAANSNGRTSWPCLWDYNWAGLAKCLPVSLPDHAFSVTVVSSDLNGSEDFMSGRADSMTLGLDEPQTAIVLKSYNCLLFYRFTNGGIHCLYW